MSIGFGIIGAGGISRRFAGVVRESERATLEAVAARDAQRAQDFADALGAKTAYSSYDDLLADPAVDAVYIGLTHNLHALWCERALLAGKHVLCEKPMALTQSDAKRLFALAKDQNLLLMEGMWTRCMPAVRKATACVQSGLIGDVRLLRASFGFNAPFSPQARLYNPLLAGGALLDAGVYPIEFAIGILNEHPTTVTGVCTIGPTGVDEVDVFTMKFPSGAIAELSCAINFATNHDAYILGTNGSLIVRDFLRSTQSELYNAEGELISTFFEDVDDGFCYEVDHFVDLIEQNLTDSPLIPAADTIACAWVFDQLLAQWNLI